MDLLFYLLVLKFEVEYDTIILLILFYKLLCSIIRNQNQQSQVQEIYLLYINLKGCYKSNMYISYNDNVHK